MAEHRSLYAAIRGKYRRVKRLFQPRKMRRYFFTQGQKNQSNTTWTVGKKGGLRAVQGEHRKQVLYSAAAQHIRGRGLGLRTREKSTRFRDDIGRMRPILILDSSGHSPARELARKYKRPLLAGGLLLGAGVGAALLRRRHKIGGRTR